MQEVQYLAREEKKERKMVIVDRELDKIHRAHKNITVDIVLAEAAKKTHPLHSYFEWDDAAAGDKYRRVQCYALIMASKFVVQLVQDGKAPAVAEKGSVRRLVSAFRGEGFTMRNEVLSDTEKRAAVIATKKSALRSWCASVIDIEELADLRKTILKKL